MSSNNHEIIVLGGNMGGVNVVHNLLRSTIPTLKRLDPSKSYHVTLVTPNTDFFFKIGSPRALINATALPYSKLFRPLSEAFSQYDASQFNLLQGVASSLDASKRTVTVTTGTEEKQIQYDSLIISTGTTSKSPLWTLHNDQSLTTKALESMHTELPKAKTVVVAGGGAVGVETAGEISAAHPSCKVTLLSGSHRVLDRVKEATSIRAQDYLEKVVHVEVVHNVRVDSVSGEHPVTLKLSDGSTREVDLYIDATGGKANSEFLPKSWLDETGRVITRDVYFRVKGNGTDDVKQVYVMGDIVAGSSNAALELDPMVTTLCSSLAVDVASSLEGAKKEEPSPGLIGSLFAKFFGGAGGYPKQLEFKPLKDTIVVPIGPSGGVGQIMGWRMPSLMVYMGKGRSYLIELIEPTITGSKWKKV
jgi:NADH dehydrogenase FAD-containing subunit